jgi:hypothetical protein
MIESKKITIDGIDFQLNPLPIFTALTLDKKVISLLLPALRDMNGMNLETEIKMGSILEALGASLDKMTDDETVKFFTDLFKGVIAIPSNQPPEELNSDGFNKIFQGKLITIYKLAGEVMKYNKFTPFVLLQAGGVTTLIDGLKSQKEEQNQRSASLEK